MFSPLDRVQQRIWSRSLVLVHVEVLKVFFQDRVLPHRVVFLAALMMDFQGIFALFSVREKVRGMVRTRGRNWVRTLLRPRRLLMWTGICLPPGLTMRGSLGGSLASGTRPGTLLFGGTILGDVAAAAGGGACGSVLGLGGRRPSCAGRPAGGGSGSWAQLFDQRDVLGGMLVAEAWVAAGAFSPGVGAHHTGDEPM